MLVSIYKIWKRCRKNVFLYTLMPEISIRLVICYSKLEKKTLNYLVYIRTPPPELKLDEQIVRFSVFKIWFRIWYLLWNTNSSLFRVAICFKQTNDETPRKNILTWIISWECRSFAIKTVLNSCLYGTRV